MAALITYAIATGIVSILVRWSHQNRWAAQGISDPFGLTDAIGAAMRADIKRLLKRSMRPCGTLCFEGDK